MTDLVVSAEIVIPERELEFQAIRASGPGGQNVNKLATAVQLRFDATASSLPERVKNRIAALRDRRIDAGGVVTIKAQRFRSQERNRDDARERLRELLLKALHEPRARQATRPTRGAVRRRLEGKRQRAQTKALRGPVGTD